MGSSDSIAIVAVSIQHQKAHPLSAQERACYRVLPEQSAGDLTPYDLHAAFFCTNLETLTSR